MVDERDDPWIFFAHKFGELFFDDGFLVEHHRVQSFSEKFNLVGYHGMRVKID